MTVTVEAGPFNGSDDVDSAMNWVDITAYVNDSLQPPGAAVGRQTELQQVNPGQLTLLLNDRDHRFTPGNPSSPYFPGWRTGMRIRMRETIGYQTFTHFDGNMLQPDVTIQTAGLDQTVTVNATDRLGRLQQGRKFVSTLAEYIMYQGGSSLKAYYPLGETKSPFRDLTGGQPAFTPTIDQSSRLIASAPYSYTPGGGGSPAGDDLGSLALAPSSTPVNNINQFVTGWQLQSNYSRSAAPISIPSATLLTIVCWVKLDATWNDNQYVFIPAFLDATNNNFPVITLFRHTYNTTDPSPGYWEAKVNDSVSGYSGSVTGTIDVGGRWMPVAIQWMPNFAWALWLDNMQFSSSTSGTLTTPVRFSGIQTVGLMSGSIAHLQIYIGSYTFAQFLAQRDAGLTGLAGQYTGQRISTVMKYAGVIAGDADIDTGTSRMQKATLAGRSPFDVMQEAATTEQGLLHAAGRRLIFHDRLRRYNR